MTEIQVFTKKSAVLVFDFFVFLYFDYPMDRSLDLKKMEKVYTLHVYFCQILVRGHH